MTSKFGMFSLFSHKNMKRMTRVISFILVFEMAFGSTVSVLASEREQAKVQNAILDQKKSQLLVNLMTQAENYQAFMRDPILKDLMAQPLDMSDKAFPKEAVDQNPFWMLGQKWTNSGSSSGDAEIGIEHRTTNEGTEIVFKSIGRTLTLPHQFQVLGASEEFILMSDSTNEGLYFFSNIEAMRRSHVDASVPIHFLPLPKDLMPVKSIVTDRSADWMIVTASNDEELTIDLSGVRFVRDFQNVILLFAQSQCITDARCRTSMGELSLDVDQSEKQMTRALPMPGSTGAHGFVPVLVNSKMSAASSSHLQNLMQAMLPKAQAFIGLESLGLDLATTAKLTWVIQVFGSLLAISVVAQFTVLKEKLARINVLKEIDAHYRKYAEVRDKLRDAKNPDAQSLANAEAIVQEINKFKEAWVIASQAPNNEAKKEALDQVEKTFDLFLTDKLGEAPTRIKTFWQNRRLEFRNTWDVLAHSITAVGQFATITWSSILNYAFDRVLTEFAAGQNTFLRKFYNFSPGMERARMSQNAVSGKTFYLGAIWSGSIDSLFVAVQYLYMVPAIANWAGMLFSPDIQAKIAASMDLNNPNTATLVKNDIIRNQLAWMQNGAAGFAQDARGIEQQTAEKIVIADLKHKGIDPSHPEFNKLKHEAVEERINKALVRLGLPDAHELLFDMNTFFQKMYEQAGYGGLEEGKRSHSTLFNRPGLSKPSLDRAIEVARRMARIDPVAANQEALQGLIDLKNEFTAIGALRKEPTIVKSQLASMVDRMTRVRYSLAALSMDGPADKVAEHIPEVWKGLSPEALRRANIMFRYSFMSLKEGDGYLELGDDFKVRENSIEVDKRAEKEKPKDGFYARWQIRRATEAAEKAVAAAKLELGTEGYEKTYNEAFRVELAATGRLTFGNGPHTEYAVQSAELATTRARETADYKKLAENGQIYEATKLLARIHSMAFLRAYQEATMENGMIRPMHPDQPGALQPLRRVSFIQNSKFLTALVRIAESSADDSSFTRLGFLAWADRTIPAFYDLRIGLLRSARSIPMAMTSGFLMTTMFWGVNFTYAGYALIVSMGFLIAGPMQYLNRIFRHVGYKPMNSTFSKTVYMVPYAMLTFAGMFPTLLFLDSANHYLPMLKDPLLYTGGGVLAYMLGWQVISRLRGENPALAIHKKMEEKVETDPTKLLEKALPGVVKPSISTVLRIKCSEIHLPRLIKPAY